MAMPKRLVSPLTPAAHKNGEAAEVTENGKQDMTENGRRRQSALPPRRIVGKRPPKTDTPADLRGGRSAHAATRGSALAEGSGAGQKSSSEAPTFHGEESPIFGNAQAHHGRAGTSLRGGGTEDASASSKKCRQDEEEAEEVVVKRRRGPALLERLRLAAAAGKKRRPPKEAEGEEHLEGEEEEEEVGTATDSEASDVEDDYLSQPFDPNDQLGGTSAACTRLLEELQSAAEPDPELGRPLQPRGRLEPAAKLTAAEVVLMLREAPADDEDLGFITRPGRLPQAQEMDTAVQLFEAKEGLRVMSVCARHYAERPGERRSCEAWLKQLLRHGYLELPRSRRALRPVRRLGRRKLKRRCPLGVEAPLRFPEPFQIAGRWKFVRERAAALREAAAAERSAPVSKFVHGATRDDEATEAGNVEEDRANVGKNTHEVQEDDDEEDLSEENEGSEAGRAAGAVADAAQSDSDG